MKSPTKQLRRKYMENQLRSTTVENRSGIYTDKEENVIEWITLFRRNWHIFVEMILGIKLKPFQKVMIYLMGVSDLFYAICSRGLSRI